MFGWHVVIIRQQLAQEVEFDARLTADSTGVR